MPSLPTMLVGAVAAAQVSLVSLITLPLPLKFRKALMKNLLESVVFAKVIFGLKISALFVAVLFADAANTFVRLNIREDQFQKPGGTLAMDGGDAGTPASMSRTSRIILAERNMALTEGTTLYLTYLLWRLFELNIENIRLEEKIAAVEGRDLGKPIEASREAFKHLQEEQKPDFAQAAADNQAVNKHTVAVHPETAPAPEVSGGNAKI